MGDEVTMTAYEGRAITCVLHAISTSCTQLRTITSRWPKHPGTE